MIHVDIVNLKRKYHELYFWQKWFFPSALEDALLNNKSNLEICLIFSKISVLQEILFTCLREFYSSSPMMIFRLLKPDSLLSASLLGNFDAIVEHKNSCSLANILNILLGTPLLSGENAQANFNSIAGLDGVPLVLVERVLEVLQQSQLLSSIEAQTNFNAIVENKNLHEVVEILNLLQQTQLLFDSNAQANFTSIFIHQYPYRLKEALSTLMRQPTHWQKPLLSGVEAQANFNALLGHEDPRRIAYALNEIQRNAIEIFHDANFPADRNVIVGHYNPEIVANALVAAQRRGLLSGVNAQTNREIIKSHNSIVVLNRALWLLYQEPGLLNQENFNLLIQYSPTLLEFETASHLWGNIPNYGISPHNFAEIINLCQTHIENIQAGQQAFIAYVNRVLLGRRGARQALNNNQSTHTASAHQSVSESAIKLKQRYSATLSKVPAIHQELSQWINGNNDIPCSSHKLKTAQRCLTRLKEDNYLFQDPISEITTEELLALFWQAIHDNSCRIGELKDARIMLVEALYEIQRGYNLSEMGIDDNNPKDRSICPPGAFNKLIEKLQGIHPDAEVRMITKGQATQKLGPVVKECLITYLKQLPILNETKKRAESLADLSDKSEGIDDESWAAIYRKVAERMFSEFGSLYHKIDNPEFMALIESGQYVSISKNELEPFLQVAPATAAVSNVGFFGRTEEKKLDTTNPSPAM